jgi:hypothetical protein
MQMHDNLYEYLFIVNCVCMLCSEMVGAYGAYGEGERSAQGVGGEA